MSDYRGGPLDMLTQIFLEILQKAAQSDSTIHTGAYVARWNKAIKYLNEILTVKG